MAGHVQRTTPTKRNPKGRWEARWRVPVGGRLRWRGKTFDTKREAERFLAATITDINRGDHIDLTVQTTTFREVAESWLESRQRTLKPKTLYGYEWILNKHLYPKWENVKVSAIDYGAVQDWVGRMNRDHEPPTTIGTYRVLRMVLGHAVKLRKLRSNPADGNVELPKHVVREREYLDHAQVERLVEAISYRPATSKHGAPRHRPDLGTYVRFAAYTGLRAGEIGALRVRHLDLSEGSVTVEEAVSDVAGKLKAGTPKTRNGVRIVGIDREMCDLLKFHLGDRRLNPDAFVFVTQRGKQWHHAHFYRQYWRDAVERAGLPKELRFHDLRHTYASFLIEANVHVAEMSRLLGHASVSITIDVYGHIMPKQTAETAAKLGSARAAALSSVAG